MNCKIVKVIENTNDINKLPIKRYININSDAPNKRDNL